MADMKMELKESLTRQQAADRLSALAKALTEGGEVDLQLGATSLRLHVPAEVRSEFEIEVDGNELELELEFRWSTAGAKAAAAAADEVEKPQPRAIPSL